MLESLNKLEKLAVSAALQETIEKLTRQLKQAESIADNLSWKQLRLIPLKHSRTNHGLTGKTGVYKIIHAPSNQVVYIGQGNLMQRRSVHRLVFCNGGETVRYVDSISKKTTSSVDSPAARKMYAFDSDPDNWKFHVCVAEKHIAKNIEEQLQSLYQPAFCDPKMSGVC